MGSNKFQQLENWLQVLIVSYQTSPNLATLKHILYYVERLIFHPECQENIERLSCYRKVQKFWQWRANFYLATSSLK